MNQTRLGKTVAYAPFSTFLSAVSALERGIPHRVDTSVWPNYSTAIRSQLVGAFRFLGLIDNSGQPTAALISLTRERANRKGVLRKILESSYARIIALDLTKASPRQFHEAIREYGMTGETHKKVVSFFLQASNYAELPISPLLRRKVRAVAPRPRRRVGEPAVGERQARPSAPDLVPAPQQLSKTISLRSGGSLTLVVGCSLLDVTADDRQFVFGLIDKLQDYESQK